MILILTRNLNKKPACKKPATESYKINYKTLLLEQLFYPKKRKEKKLQVKPYRTVIRNYLKKT